MKSIADMFNNERPNARNKARMPTVISLVNIMLESLASAIRQEKKMKEIQMEKEIKLYLLMK